MSRCGSLHQVADRIALWCAREPDHDGLHAYGRNVWARGDTIAEPGVWWIPGLPPPPAIGWKTIGVIKGGL